MWEKLKNSRWSRAAIAILAAIICWLYVDLARKPDAKVMISNIPVNYIGVETLEEEGLFILDEDPSISVKVSGPRSVITRLDRNNITITAEVGNITEAGVYSVKCDVNLPSSVTSASSSPVSVVSKSASAVDVTVVKKVSKTIEIIPEFTGTVADDHFYDDDSFALQQRELEISGEESIVNSVSFAKVVLSEQNLSDTWTGYLDVVLCDQTGQEIQPENLTLETEAISAAFYVECKKDIKLAVNLVSGGGATQENAQCDIEPKTVTVVGQEVVLDSLEELNLGEVDLGQIVTTGEYEFPIELPNGVSLMDGERETAKVQVSITGLETRRIMTSNIKLVNAPEGYRYEYNDLEVRVRGKADGFAVLMSEDIQVTLDLEQHEVTEGETLTVPAQIEIIGISELGVLGTYSVEVSVLPEITTDETTEVKDIGPETGVDAAP